MSDGCLKQSRFAKVFSLAQCDAGETDGFTRPQYVSQVGALWPSEPLKSQKSPQDVSLARPQLLALSSHFADFQTGVSGFNNAEFIRVLSGERTPAGAFAYNYGGHQFGYWAGQLGDGRALVIGESKLGDGSCLELQLKGSGRTPFSRRGDGLAVLRSSLREFLMSEAMFGLGIPTTRALSLVLSGQQVLRDRFYDGRPGYEPGAIVCRTAPSFLRFGNFELLAQRGHFSELRSLIRFTAEEQYGLSSHLDDQNIGMELIHAVSRRTAALVAAWQSVGFVHGVLNTDNMSVVGLTLDYGPFGVMDEFEPGYTPNTSDLPGRRYCYANQPGICRWNVAMFAQAVGTAFGLSRFVEGNLEDSQIVQAALKTFDHTFEGEITGRWQRRLGYSQLQSGLEVPQQTSIRELLRLLQKYRFDLNYVLREYSEALRAGTPENFLSTIRSYGKLSTESALVDETSERHALVDDWRKWLESDSAAVVGLSHEERGHMMCTVNPRFVLHNRLLTKMSDRMVQRILHAQAGGDAIKQSGEEISEILKILYSPCDDSDLARQLSEPIEPKERRPEDCLNSCSS
jgi:uncharacterized protein YdiU (UPF0061 family)